MNKSTTKQNRLQSTSQLVHLKTLVARSSLGRQLILFSSQYDLYNAAKVQVSPVRGPQQVHIYPRRPPSHTYERSRRENSGHLE